jgi:hypothetical protein
MGSPLYDENSEHQYGEQPVPLPPSMSHPPSGQPFSGPPYAGEPYASQPYPGQPFPSQPYPGQPYSDQPSANQPYSGVPYSGQPYSGQPYSGQPLSGPPSMGYGPMNPAYAMGGQQMSDKSKITAGLLQLLLGLFFTLGGVGRLYAGNTTLGMVQIGATVVAWVSFWCGFLLVLPFVITAGIWIWFVVDGIIMLAGRPVDGQGRLLRS